MVEGGEEAGAQTDPLPGGQIHHRRHPPCRIFATVEEGGEEAGA
jgi:hypothetical protein